MAYPDDPLMLVNPGQPIPAELINAHSHAIAHHTHGTQTQRYPAGLRRLGSGAWSIATTVALGAGSIAEQTNGNQAYYDITPPPAGSIIKTVRMKVKDGGAGALLQFQLLGSKDDGTADDVIATLVSSGSGALEVVPVTANFRVPDIGAAASNLRLHAIVSTTGGSSAAMRRFYEFAYDYYRP